MILSRSINIAVNKNESGVVSVKLTHRPSGLWAEAHSTSYELSKEEATEALETKLGEPIERFVHEA